MKKNKNISNIHNNNNNQILLNDKQYFSSSLDHNSLETDTAATDVLNSQNNDSSKFSSAGSDSSSSAASNHSKEYFTIGNRFDPTGLSLLNNIIPDDDDDMLAIGLHNINNTTNNNGTLGKSKNVLKQNSNKMNFELPNKSFNTYSNQRDVPKTNSKIGSSNLSNSIKGLNINTNNTNANNNSNNNTLRYSNFINNFQSGSIRSNAKQQRTAANSLMRTNIDQEL